MKAVVGGGRRWRSLGKGLIRIGAKRCENEGVNSKGNKSTTMIIVMVSLPAADRAGYRVGLPNKIF
jgi:hypothetical protein